MPNQEFVRSVPIPNLLFDEYLPALTDTELRVLLIVFRSTLGWRESDGAGNTRFKQRDWINHVQLQRRTGRSSAAVSTAVQSLVLKSLIIVENWRGEPLATPDLRRANIGKVFYRPGALWITPQQRDNGQALTTTYRHNKIHSAAYVENSGGSDTRPMRSPASGFERIGTILENLPGSDVPQP